MKRCWCVATNVYILRFFKADLSVAFNLNKVVYFLLLETISFNIQTVLPKTANWIIRKTNDLATSLLFNYFILQTSTSANLFFLNWFLYFFASSLCLHYCFSSSRNKVGDRTGKTRRSRLFFWFEQLVYFFSITQLVCSGLSFSPRDTRILLISYYSFPEGFTLGSVFSTKSSLIPTHHYSYQRREWRESGFSRSQGKPVNQG